MLLKRISFLSGCFYLMILYIIRIFVETPEMNSSDRTVPKCFNKGANEYELIKRTVMSRLNWVLFLFCFSVMLQAQETEKEKFLWPVEGKNAGENILYRPQDYIGDEHNFGDLFVTAEKGTDIVCPCDGVVIGFGYGCNPTLTSSVSFHVEGTLAAAADSCREYMAKYGIDTKFLSAYVRI